MISTTYSAISSTSAGSARSSKGPSLNNMCLSPSVAIWHHLSRAHRPIRALPPRKSWRVKTMHPASFLRIFFILRQRKTAFSIPLYPFHVHIVIYGCMVRHNTETMAPFPNVGLLRVMFFASKKHSVMDDHNEMTTSPWYVFPEISRGYFYSAHLALYTIALVKYVWRKQLQHSS